MRSYSLTAIVLLCLGLVLIDVLTYYWLQTITHFLASPKLKIAIDIAFWMFTIGLVTAILVLKIRLDNIPSRRRHVLISSFYGLTVSSFVPKVIFILVASVLYFTNYAFSESDSAYVVLIVGLFSGFLPFFVILYAILIGLYRFKTHHVKLHCPQLPDSFDGLRIVHISDAHLGSFNARYPVFDRAVRLVNDLQPDFIFFTGDLVNNYAWELNGWEESFLKFTAKRGKYAVLGNHDYGDYSDWDSPEEKAANLEAVKDFYSAIDFKLLLNEAVTIFNGHECLAVIGVENWGSPPFPQYGNLEKAMEHTKHVPFKLLLSHDPSHWEKEVVKATQIAVTFSGHTHGMQAGIKLRSKHWSPIQYKYKQWAGLYQKGAQYLYVNRGLGWLGFPGRLGMRPEITCIDFSN